MVIRKEGWFEAAHVLSDYAGACGNLHGHSYHYEVQLMGGHEDDMLVDFNEIKRVISQYDHAFLAACSAKRDSFEDALVSFLHAHEKKIKTIISGRPTAENIGNQIALELCALSDKVRSVRVLLKETASSEVECYDCR